MNNGVTASDSRGGGGSSGGEEGGGAVRQALLQDWYAQTAAPYARTGDQLPSNANASLVPSANVSLYSNPQGPSPLPPPPPPPPPPHREHQQQVGNDMGRDGGFRDLSRPAVDLAREVADKDAQIERLNERLKLALKSQSQSLAGDGGGGEWGGGGGGGGEWMSSSRHSAGALEASALASLTKRNVNDQRAPGQP